MLRSIPNTTSGFSTSSVRIMLRGMVVKNEENTSGFWLTTYCIALWKDKGMLRDDVDPAVATTAFLGVVGYSMVERGLLENPNLTDLDVGALVDSLSAVFLSGILA